MKPPYEISTEILTLVSSISEKVGEVNANYLNRPSPKLRKENRIKTIHASLKIEGNTLTEGQITSLLENKRIIGPEKDVLEVLNAIRVYEEVSSYVYHNEKSFLKAHSGLMQGLLRDAGKYRKQGVGIVKGDEIAHLAPSHKNVPFLMNDLFNFLKNDNEITLIKSCVFHYEMEFIHPFEDGNGRMGRLWQSVILQEQYPVFEFLPFETLISKDQENYYGALAESDRCGQSTPFIEYMLGVIDNSLKELLNFTNKTMNERERLSYFAALGKKTFTRKDYMMTFKEISTATASRDLLKGVELQIFKKSGEKNKTVYRVQ